MREVQTDWYSASLENEHAALSHFSVMMEPL